jgi:hypothetical protein
MQKDLKCYALIGSDFAVEDSASADYFFTIISKTFPEHKWEKIYTDEIPLDGNIYICLQNATSELYKSLVQKKIFKAKDILKDFIYNESFKMYVCSFNYDLNAIKESREVKKSVFSFLTNIVKVNIDKISAIEEKEDLNVLSEVITSSTDTIIEDSPITDSPSIIDETKFTIEEIDFLIEDLVSQMIDGTSKIADKVLDNFEGIKLYSSSNPKYFITLALSGRKEYVNKVLISELFIILKAAKMMGTDSIKFSVKKSAIHN